MNHANLFIVGGPSGVGKTTYVRRVLPQEMRCWEFADADLIAAGLSPFRPASVELEAGRILEVNGEPLPPEEARELLRNLTV